MGTKLTKEQQAFFDETKEFALSFIAPRAEEWEKAGCVPKELSDELRKRGYLGMICPKELGGGGKSLLETVLAVEAIAHGDGGAAFFTELTSCCSYDTAVTFGPDESLLPIMKELCSGEKVVSFAFTEPGAGTDPFAGKAYAEEREDGWHIFGEKTWASNCLEAGYFLAFVNIGDPREMGAFLVDADSPGISIENRTRLGGNLISSGTVKFEDVVVSKERLLSREAYRLALHTIDIARIFVSAMAVGFAQRALDITKEYLSGRSTFGKPVIKNQYIQFKLAELWNKTEAARCFLYHNTSLVDEGEDISLPAAKLKLFCPNTGWEVVSECSHLWGGIGCEYNTEITRLLGNAKATMIEDGTAEVQKMVLARALFK